MKRLLLVVFMFGLTVGALAGEKPSPIRAGNLCCEYLPSPDGVDTPCPRLSWELITDGERLFDMNQTAYRIWVGRSKAELLRGDHLLWDSGWVESDETTQIVYAGEPLASDTVYYWNVRIRDSRGGVSTPNAIGRWSTGWFDPETIPGEWIGSDALYSMEGEGDDHPGDPMFRKKFNLDEVPSSALLRVASVGYHEVYVNGARIDDHVLAPNVSDHNFRARYVTYDIAGSLLKGSNVVALRLGPSWSVYSFYKRPDRPMTPIVRAWCEMKLSDDKSFLLSTDASWKTAPSESRLLGRWTFGWFGGEHLDANLIEPNWNRLAFDDSAWKQASVYAPNLKISPQLGEPNRLGAPISAVGIEETEPGVWRVDMGVNFAGWTEIQIEDEPGRTVEFQFSESLLSPMTFRNYSRLTLDSAGKGTFKNRFNYSSGRWITVRGLSKKPIPENFRGWSIRTDYQRAASFECSDDLANWIYRTVLWTFENLSIGGYIVDCPQRERMGYGGDAHATSETGLYNYKLGAFYTKWLEDWRDVQGWRQAWLVDGPQPIEGTFDTAAAGTLPNTAPTYFGGGGPAWGGIVVTLPWSLYVQYGDKRVLEDNFELMTKWLAFLNAYVRDGLLYRYGDQWCFLGDWLWPGAPDGPNSDTDDTLCLNNIYRVFNLATAAKIARVIGRDEEAQAWEKLADEARQAIHTAYFHPEDNAYFDGRMSIQSAALLADIPPMQLREGVMKRLEDEILVNQKGHIGAGITGGALLFRLLRQEGRDDLIWSMISQTEYPGWGFMRENGATTIWEAWELNRPGHSLLHSSYLYPGAWYIDSLLGIRPDANRPGFRHIVIHPPKTDATSLTWAKGHFNAPTGKITVDWKKIVEQSVFQLKIHLPPNTRGTIYVPSNGKDAMVSVPARAVWLRDETGYSVYDVPSGSYEFRSRQ